MINSVRHLLRKGIVLIFFSISVGFTYAATINGVVRDCSTNNPIPGANVLVVGTTIAATTGVSGNFILSGITPGATYTIRASFVGYSNADYTIDIPAEEIYNLTMLIGSPTVTVSGDATICQGGTSTVTFNFTGTPNYQFTVAVNGTDAGSPFSTTDTYTMNVSPSSTSTYTVSALGDQTCNTSNRIYGSATITVNPTPTVTTQSNIVVNPGETISPSAFSSTPSGATFSWTNTNTAIGLASSGTGNIASYTAPANLTGAPITANISVTGTLSSCMGSPMTFTITINPDPYVVTNTGEGGPGSLDWCITNANASANETITFNIPGTGPFIIQPDGAVPPITSPMTIDAYTQPGASANTSTDANNANILVEYSALYQSTSGLVIQADNTIIRGLVIRDSGMHGIEISNANGVRIEGNYIGTISSGDIDSPNLGSGVYLTNARNCTIGGSSPSQYNIIGSNSDSQITIEGATSSGNKIIGNFIGLDRTGISFLGPETQAGILLTNAPNNFIGSSTATDRNYIVNQTDGIILKGTNASGNTIQGNFIGTDVFQAAPAPNSSTGIFMDSDANSNIIGGVASGEGNTIVNSGNHGVLVQGAATNGNSIRGNKITCSGADNISLFNGGNNSQPIPVIEYATSDSVSGTASANGNVDLYMDVSGCDPQGGTFYVGSETANSSGFWSFSGPGIVNSNTIITATTTTTNGTSQFSDPVLVPIGFASNTMATTNKYVDLEFDFPAYGDNSASTPVSPSDLNLIFNANGGTALTVTISSIRRNDNTNEASATPLSGGESVVRIFLNVTGIPTGVEEITFQATSDNSIFDEGGLALLSSMESPEALFNPAPVITNTVFDFGICTGSSTNIDVQADIIGTTFTWIATPSSSFISGFSSTGTANPIVETLTNSNTTTEFVRYSVTPVNNQIMGVPVDFTVNVSALPNLMVDMPADTLCSGESTQITLSSSDISVTYDWTTTGTSGVTGYSDGSGSSIDQVLTIGGNSIGSVNYLITPSINGCANTPTTVTVYVNPVVGSPSVNAISGPGNVCEGQTDVGYTAVAITGATEYVWAFTNGVDFSATSSTNSNAITIDIPKNISTTDITVAGKNRCGTGTTATFNVNVNAGADDPGAITGPDIICQGAQNIQFTIPSISNADGYAWILDFTGNLPTQRFFTNTPDLTTDFAAGYQGMIISVGGYNACDSSEVFSSKTVQANLLPLQAATPTGPDAACADSEITLSVPAIDNASEYVWELPANFTPVSGSNVTNTNSIDVNTGTTTSTFNVNVKGQNECGQGTQATTFYRITIMESPMLAIDAPVEAYLGQTIDLFGSETSGQSITSWAWDFGDGNGSADQNTTHRYTKGGDFNVLLSAVNDLQCENSTETTIQISDELPVTIMNVITPNGDGKNDGLYIEGLELFPENQLNILNRMGIQVYTIDNYDNNWNGPFLTDGNYVVIFKVTGTDLSKKQTVSVIN